MIVGYINGQSLDLHHSKVVEKSVDYLTADFQFMTNEWKGFRKWVHFSKGDIHYQIELKNDKVLKTDHLNLSAGEWDVYIHGSLEREVITTNKAKLVVEATGELEGEYPEETPIPPYDDILNKMGDIEDLETTDKSNLVNAINEVLRKANQGGGTGEGGNGVGIERIEQTTTSTESSGKNVITMYLTNGDSYNFEVTNGRGIRVIDVESQDVPLDRPTSTAIVRTDFSDGKSQYFSLLIPYGKDGEDGKDGKSGVYVGSGEMPNGYNVQIDPDGEAVLIPTKVSELENDVGYITDEKFKTQAENEEPTYGEELASADGWTADGWTGDFVNGFTNTSGNTNPLIFTMPEETAQNTYRIAFRCSKDIAPNALMVKCGGSELFDLYGQNAEPLTVGIVSVENGNVEFVPLGTFTGTITDISIKRVTGIIPTEQTITDSTGKTSFEIRTTKANQNNIFLGNNAGENNVSGYGCVALGSGALNKNTSGFWNIGVGYNTLRNNTVGSRNVVVGYTALGNNITGSRNIALGSFALNRNTTGNKNIAIGADSIDHNISGSENVGIGYSTLYNNTTGSNNLAIGSQAIAANTTGMYNTAVGAEAMNGNTTGNYNVAIGAKALSKNGNASNNVAIGYTALYGCKAGKGNAAIGLGAGKGANGTFNYGVFLGFNTGAKSTNGADYNVFIGYNAGDNVTMGANNICIGKNARTPTETTSNYLNIGDLIVGSMATADKYAKINGGLQLSDIPTSDPAIAGRVWNDNGTLKVSVG